MSLFIKKLICGFNLERKRNKMLFFIKELLDISFSIILVLSCFLLQTAILLLIALCSYFTNDFFLIIPFYSLTNILIFVLVIFLMLTSSWLSFTVLSIKKRIGLFLTATMNATTTADNNRAKSCKVYIFSNVIYKYYLTFLSVSMDMRSWPQEEYIHPSKASVLLLDPGKHNATFRLRNRKLEFCFEAEEGDVIFIIYTPPSIINYYTLGFWRNKYNDSIVMEKVKRKSGK